MPIKSQRRGSAAALADVFEDLQPLIHRAARRFARQTGEDYDEAVAEATLIFVEAYHTHDPAKSKLEQRADFLLRNRLQERARKWAKNDARLHRTDADPGQAPAKDVPERCSLGALSRRLGPNGRRILALVLDSPPELDELIRNDPKPGPESVRRWLIYYARREWGWGATQTRAAFEEIADAI